MTTDVGWIMRKFRASVTGAGLGLVLSMLSPTPAAGGLMAMADADGAGFGRIVEAKATLDDPAVPSNAGPEFSRLDSTNPGAPEGVMLEPLVLIFLVLGLLVFFFRIDRADTSIRWLK